MYKAAVVEGADPLGAQQGPCDRRNQVIEHLVRAQRRQARAEVARRQLEGAEVVALWHPVTAAPAGKEPHNRRHNEAPAGPWEDVERQGGRREQQTVGGQAWHDCPGGDLKGLAYLKRVKGLVVLLHSAQSIHHLSEEGVRAKMRAQNARRQHLQGIQPEFHEEVHLRGHRPPSSPTLGSREQPVAFHARAVSPGRTGRAGPKAILGAR